MSDLIPGEIVALKNVPDTDGTWRLAAAVATGNGQVEFGVLVAPKNAAAGQIGFEPVPRLLDGFGQVGTDPYLPAPMPAPAPAPPTTDPDDPRGIRNKARRGPGMLG